jgi:phage-related protein
MTYVPTIVTIDAYDLAGVGFICEASPGLRSVVEHTYQTVRVADLPGAALLDTTPAVAVREFTITGILTATTAAAMRTNKRLLEYRAGGTTARVITVVDDTSRRITARLRSMDFAYAGKELDATEARVTMQWQALTPYWEDGSTTTVNLTTSNADCALGTVAVYPIVTINAATTPTLTYKNSAGSTVYSMTLTTIAGGQSVIIDMLTRTITHSVSGVTPSLRTAGRFFALDPYDGDYPTSAWPKLVLSSGTGTAVYRKAYHG